MKGLFYAQTDGDKSQVNYIACAIDYRFSIEVTNRAEAEAGAVELNRVIREVVAATHAAAKIVWQSSAEAVCETQLARIHELEDRLGIMRS